MVIFQPNGEDIPVSGGNREEFVGLYLDYILNSAVKERSQYFSIFPPFRQICNTHAIAKYIISGVASLNPYINVSFQSWFLSYIFIMAFVCQIQLFTEHSFCSLDMPTIEIPKILFELSTSKNDRIWYWSPFGRHYMHILKTRNSTPFMLEYTANIFLTKINDDVTRLRRIFVWSRYYSALIQAYQVKGLKVNTTSRIENIRDRACNSASSYEK